MGFNPGRLTVMGEFTMRCFFSLLTPVMVLAACVAGVAQTRPYNMGSTPSPEEIRAMDVNVGPSGKELPPGNGTAKEGARVFAQQCAPCHGRDGEGTKGLGPVLVGGKGSLASAHAVETVGSFFPLATTVWSYINRSMPAQKPGSLSANEVYAVTAFLLYRNEIIQESDVLDAKTLPKVKMPNRDGFVPAVPVWPETVETKRISGELMEQRRR